MLAALLEAALAALYLEHGFEPIAQAIVEAFEPQIEFALTSQFDHKTELQERLARSGRNVNYIVLEVAGPPHDRTFTAAAVIDAADRRHRERPVEEGRRAGRGAAGARQIQRRRGEA